MIKRNIYKKLDKAINARQIIAITGLRRSGKTTALKYLIEKINSKNKIYLDLERMEYRKIFQDDNYGNIIKALEIYGINLSEKSWIFLDEIQLVKNIGSVLKYLYDNYPIKFVVTGSSSFYMKGTLSESLAGRKILFDLWPLSFDEFLTFKGENAFVLTPDLEQTPSFYIDKYKAYYEEYVEYGGFPEVALSSSHDNKIDLLKDIFDSFLKLDILFLSDFTKTEELYKLIVLLSARTGSKIDYTKLSGISGINRHKVKDYLLFLEKTFFIRIIRPYVLNRDREIALQPKIYFTDNGLLKVAGQISGGALFENSIANQLSLKGELAYYAKRTGQEIDFILNKKTAIEVKETPSSGDLKTLMRRANSINLTSTALIGRHVPPGSFTEYVWGGAIMDEE
ncbi:MAG: ATP-binding protein [Bacteroidetes bacterium]|nr:MAG: ATP-binding protein [Bacteroidota bacterium]